MRLNFSFMTPERITEGIRILADLLKMELSDIQ
jgi:DNA-binding transcriptional MocR family regulator